MSPADAAAAPILVGGRYELVERLGQGTTCEVHLARTVRRDGEVALVALRRPLPAFAADPRFVEELLASGRRASQLLHPGIARVLDVSSDPRAPYVATEYVHGEQLAAVQRRLVPGQRPLDLLLRVIAQAAEAVEHAHAARTPLVHGSITPQNLFVAYDGEVRVADFGTPRPSIGPDDTQNREHAGIAYWSPEQAAQRIFQAPADVFALGVILWECITQRRLFAAPTRAETRALVKRCEVPRPGDMTDCPAALERLVMRCLARDPHDRFPSAGVLADELADLLEKRRRDAGPDAIRRLMQDLFAQRKAGRDATLRRALHPSRESYAPLAAASPSIPPSGAKPTREPPRAAARNLAPASTAGSAPEESGPRPKEDRSREERSREERSRPSEPISGDRESPTAAARAASATPAPTRNATSEPEAPASRQDSSVTSDATATPTAGPTPISIATAAHAAASTPTTTSTSTSAATDTPTAATRARRTERSLAAWGGLAAIGLGLLAVLGVLAQVVTTPRHEAPRPALPASGTPGATQAHSETPPAIDPAVEPSIDPAIAPRIDPAVAPSIVEPRTVEPSIVEPRTVEPSIAEPSIAEPSESAALEDPRDEPALEAAAFPTLDDDHGTLEIICRPAAEIFVDNRSLGLTPRIVDVPEGPIAIGLRSTGPGHAWRTLRRTVEPRGTLSIPLGECP